MRKRWLSILLVLCMILTLVPVFTTQADAEVKGDDYPYKDLHTGTDPWNFVYGNCTSFVAWRLNSANGVNFTNQYGGVDRWGNGGDWGPIAQSLGIPVDMNPRVGSVAWIAANPNDPKDVGHVAWVAEVKKGTVVVEEYNWNYDYSYHTKEWDISHYSGFIHIRDLEVEGACGENLTWKLDGDGLLTITGTGEMADYSFEGTPWNDYRSFIRSVAVTDGVTSIGSWAFQGCTNLTSVTISESVKRIGVYAFNGCSGLTSIAIPKGVALIDRETFNGCASLASVTIPESVKDIYSYAFNGCSSLTDVHYGGTKEQWKQILIGDSNDPLTQATLHAVPAIVGNGTCGEGLTWTLDDDGLLTISGTGEIKYDSFKYKSSIRSVVIADGVTGIGSQAFYKCENLASVKIPSSVTRIGGSAFQYCTSLPSVTIPSSVTSIGACAFSYCYSLKSVEIPESVTSIPDYMFCMCAGLTNVTIPSSVTSIGREAFNGCNSLTSVTIPGSVKSIDTYAFVRCTGLKSVTIQDGVPYIGFDMFSGCSSLTSVTLPESVTCIWGDAFAGCSSLTSVTIPKSVTRIGGRAFAGCGLTSVTIPENVRTIESGVFAGCQALPAITVAPENPYYVSIDGVLYSKDGSKLVAYPTGKGDKTYEILPSVTQVYGSVFSGCTSLTRVTIPAGVTSIGTSVFNGCSSLMSITIPKGVMSIGEYAFYGCSSLTSVTIPEGVTSIGRWAFNSCTGITSVTLPSSIRSIAGNAFRTYSNLTDVYYGGTEAQWKKVSIDSRNEPLWEAKIHYLGIDLIITAQPQDYYGVLDSRAKFTVAATGAGLTYQWQYSDDHGATWSNSSVRAASYSTNLTAARDGRMVRCVITDQTGKTLISDAATMMLSKLAITAQPKDYIGKKGSTAKFTVKAVGDGLTYQWQISDNGGKTWKNSSVKKADYSTSLTASKDGRMVRCIVTDQYGVSVTSSAVSMTISKITITTQPKDYVGKVNSTAKFTVKAVGEGLTYQWQYSESMFWENSSVKAASYSTKLTDARDGRRIRCVITDRYGTEVATDSVTMKIG